MHRPSLLLLLTAVISGCNDGGLTPPETEPADRPHDVFIAIGTIPGIYTFLRTLDSLGRTKTSFSLSEPVFLRYSLINGTGRDQTMAMGGAYPFARFFVIHGADTLVDSFAGRTFAAVVLGGTLKNGDSLTAAWKLDPGETPLPAGAYLTTGSPRFMLVGLGVPGDSWSVFDVTP